MGSGKMPNKNYIKGVRKERKLKKKLESEGYVVLRTAGSHGFADLVAIDKDTVRFIQVKPDNFSEGQEVKLTKEFQWCNKMRVCSFEVL